MLTRHVGLRVGVVLILAGLLWCTGCDSDTKDTIQEYKTKVKAESTADANYQIHTSDSGMTESNRVTGEKSYSINLNQVGYRPKDKKIAVVSNNSGVNTYQVLDGSGNTVYSGELTGEKWDEVSKGVVQFADFSTFTTPGAYYIICGDNLFSDEFVIDDSVYDRYYNSLCDYFSNTIAHMEAVASSDEAGSVKAKVYGTDEEIEVSGGWYNLTDRGQYTVDSTTTIASLYLMYDAYSDMGLSKKTEEILQPERTLYLIRRELEWLLPLQNTKGGVYHKVTTTGSKKNDGSLVAYPVSTCATADFAAVMAKAYRYFYQTDYDFANTCLFAAQKAWYYLQDNTDNVMFTNPKGVETPEYTDDDDRDERFWAAMELSLTTKRSDYVTYVAEHIDTGFYIGFTWQRVAGFGIIDAMLKGESILSTDTYNRVNSLMDVRVHSILSNIDLDKGQINYTGSVTFQKIISEGVTLELMGQYKSEDHLYQSANLFLNYLMGDNAYSVNYIGEADQLDSLDMDYVAKIGVLLVGLNEKK